MSAILDATRGALADLIRRHDWAATALGPIGAWPTYLTHTVAQMLLSPVPYVLLWGIDGVMIYNDAYASFAGSRHPGCLGAKVREAWPEIADFNDHVIRAGLSGRPLSYRAQELTLHRNGRPERAWLDLDYAPVLDDTGRPAGVLVIVIETTERVLAERDLRVSRELERENAERVQLALAAGAIIGTWVWDLPSDRFTIDEAFALAFGLDPALGRVGLSLAQIIATVHPDDRTGLMAATETVIARGGPYAHQYRVRRADGHYYWLEANGRVEVAPDGTPLRFPGVLIDLESRRAIEAERDMALAKLRTLNETLEQRVAERTAELMRTEAALRQSQKMEAVGQLTGGLAHDFNNLLAGIVGALELVEIRLRQDRVAELGRYVGAAQDAARRATALTHRLLAFSRRQTLDPRPRDVNVLIDGMAELVARTVGPQIRLETDPARDLWTALVDGSQLENALLNLCLNARDAMPDGGRIRIVTRNVSLDAAGAAAQHVTRGDYLRLSVSDTGTGMTPDVLAKAFDPFFTTKPLGQGTGLGLSMIYGFARQSGGAVGIESAPGRGTTVTILLPRHHGAAAPDAPREAALPAGRARTERTVLLVDDEPSVRLLVREVLDELGYAAVEAADSVAGLALLRSDIRLDLLITDVGLPGGMNGRQLADAGLQLRPGLKVLFITGYAETAVLNHGDLTPQMAVLTKPFTIDALGGRIAHLLDPA